MRGKSLSRAVIASVGLHVLLAGVVVSIARWQAGRPVAPPSIAIETRADVQFDSVSEAPGIPVEVNPLPEERSFVRLPDLPDSTKPEPRVEESVGPPLANAIAIPRTLPSEMLGLLRKISTASIPSAEESHAPSAIQPAAAATPRMKSEPAWAAAGSPVHGALDPKQSIVYVLDASGSMGEWGKFDAARGALIATLRLQPESVRFQVVVYSGTSTIPVRGTAGECLPATAANIARSIEALQLLGTPAGRSSHVEGLRSALAFRPDVVLILTDADDLPATAFRGVVRQAAKSATICVARVDARGVGSPAEVK